MNYLIYDRNGRIFFVLIALLIGFAIFSSAGFAWGYYGSAYGSGYYDSVTIGNYQSGGYSDYNVMLFSSWPTGYMYYNTFQYPLYGSAYSPYYSPYYYGNKASYYTQYGYANSYPSYQPVVYNPTYLLYASYCTSPTGYEGERRLMGVPPYQQSFVCSGGSWRAV